MFRKHPAHFVVTVLLLATTGCGSSSSVAPASSSANDPSAQAGWTPEPASYGVGHRYNELVTMADGTVLSADVYFPTDRASGEAAPGPFPVILVQTPYGKEASVVPNLSLLNQYSKYLIQRGYIQVIADIRGTGSSQGGFDLLDPVQGQDGAALVHWASRLPQTNGKVGLLGNSYLGIIQYLTAAAVGPNSPLKAIFPIDAENDFYRDIVVSGGMPATGLLLAYAGLTSGLNLLNPVIQDIVQGPPSVSPAVVTTPLEHATALQNYPLSYVVNVFTGGSFADTELIATLDDFAPDGSSVVLTSGALLGSHRALDPHLSWYAPDGNPLLPYHPYTKAAQTPVTPGQITRYDIEVFPTVALLKAGHQLRVRVETSKTPLIIPTPLQLATLVGGVYQIQYNTAGASFAVLPLAPASAFTKSSVSFLQSAN
jgi:alpha/beta superfamily hydrolase